MNLKMKEKALLIPTAFFLISAPFMTGCNTMEGALVGAGLGAGTGALMGSTSHNAGTGTAIGAGAGAIIGGIMGAQFEQMEKQRAQQATPPEYPVGGTGPAPVSQTYSPYQPAYYPPSQGNVPVPQTTVRPEPPQQAGDVPKTATPITTVVSCPNCKQTLDVSEFRKGTKVRCPACNEVFVY